MKDTEPWFYVNQNYPEINAEAEERDPDSILNFYRKCLRLRKSSETLLSALSSKSTSPPSITAT